jgi:cytochrome P450
MTEAQEATTQSDPGEKVFDDQFFADPYATYARMHAEGCPVRRVVTPEGIPAWLVTEHDAVRDALKDPRLSRRLAHAGSEYRRAPYPTEFLTGSVVTEDPPEHTRLRRMLNQAFSPRSIGTMTPRVEAITAELLDQVKVRLDAGETIDLVAEFAVLLPITVIAEMLGVPLERRDDFRRWGDGMLGLDRAVQAESSMAMLGFLTELIAAKTAHPQDDMLSQWVTARDEAGGALEQKEIIGLALVVLVGGYDTSVGMIASTLLALLSDDGKYAELRAAPEILPDVVEEYLRLYGTVQTGVRRFATEGFGIGGEEIAAGDTVLISLGAANHDPARHPDPDAADFHRSGIRNHLAFALGPHVCPGNELARIEIATAVRAVMEKLPQLRLAVAPDQIDWRRAYFIRIPLALPVTWGPPDRVVSVADRAGADEGSHV